MQATSNDVVAFSAPLIAYVTLFDEEFIDTCKQLAHLRHRRTGELIVQTYYPIEINKRGKIMTYKLNNIGQDNPQIMPNAEEVVR